MKYKQMSEQHFSKLWNEFVTGTDVTRFCSRSEIFSILLTGSISKENRAKVVSEVKTTVIQPGGDDYGIYTMVFTNVTYLPNKAQVCAWMDEGNHCFSEGSIFAEDNYVIITWSDKGHI